MAKACTTAATSSFVGDPYGCVALCAGVAPEGVLRQVRKASDGRKRVDVHPVCIWQRWRWPGLFYAEM